ncbi:ATP-binding protein [Salipaludibacillus daqingensis]|uniref:ATP-binding protein n=1 Tax=Salipaludibacillus daqingensis TaxID=3041001 RepID=UPI0024756854|nr:ATP-binding protein [Salipaludibacillus daqingensis]
MNKDISKIHELTNNSSGDRGAHILYMFNEYDKYIKNAIEYICEGLDNNDKILLVENDEFFKEVNQKIRDLGYTEKHLTHITYVNNVDFYLPKDNFDAANGFKNLVDLIKPNIAKDLTTRIWGQVLVKESFIIELRKYECDCNSFMGKENVISVCSYNALNVSSFTQNEMLKVHQFFMQDDKIMKSPLYHPKYVSEVEPDEKNKLKKIEKEYQLMKEKNKKIIMENAFRKEREKNLNIEKHNAEKANEMKNIFLSQMSHDLRTPLNSISGFTQLLLEDDKFDPKNKSMLNKISDSSNHLLALIDEILDFSAIEAGNIKLDMKPIPVHSFINECIETLSTNKNHPIDAAIDQVDKRLMIEADELRLKQILNNLLTNAIKFNPSKGKIYVSIKEDKITSSIKINVTDSGIGLPKDGVDRLFEPFYRSERNMKKWKGTGLGLAIVANLSTKMNGNYGAYNNQENGATFWVSFKKTTMVSDVSIDEKKTEKEFLVNHSKLKKVIYIEDQQDNIDIMEAMLESIDEKRINVISKNTGHEGIFKARELKPDIIFLDLGLPDINGRDVLKQLKSSKFTNKIPVIAVSADANDSTIKELLENGCDDYITKPIDLKKLKAIIFNNLG